MSSNRRRHANALPLLTMATWIVVAGFICAAGLGYVYCKNQLHQSGREKQKLEDELVELRRACEVAQTKIASLSSRAELQRKLTSGFIKLIPITDDRLVRIGPMPGSRAGADDELRAVAIERVSR
jgi:hypothetical protein